MKTDAAPGPTAGQRHFEVIIQGLRPFSGRWSHTLRYVLASTVVIVLAMSLHLPLLGLSLFVVFMATQSNVVVVNLLTELGFIIVSLAIGAVLLILLFAYESPAARVGASTALIFLCAFLMRASKLGKIFFIVGIALAASQQYLDSIPSAELLVRACLWVWIACLYPLVLCAIINAFLWPVEPLSQLKQLVHEQLTVVDQILGGTTCTRSNRQEPTAANTLNNYTRLQTLMRFSWMRNAEFRASQALHQDYAAAIALLQIQAEELARQQASVAEPGDQTLTVEVSLLRGAIARLDHSIQNETPFTLNATERADARLATNSAATGMWHTLIRLTQRVQDTTTPAPTKQASGMLAPDAWSNPMYTEFAIKTTLGVFISYLVYTGADWGGIHTMALTALIVAEPSPGAASSKMVLRVMGAVIGAACALIATIVFVPQAQTIFGLLLICIPVLALAAYIASGPPSVSYIGIQLAFTFALTMLGGFWPSTDLVDIRDRVIGIGLGIGLAFFLQTSLWPESEAKALHARIRQLLQLGAQTLRQMGTAQQDQQARTSLLEALPALAEAQSMLGRIALEPAWNARTPRTNMHLQQLYLAKLRQLLSAAGGYALAHAVHQHETSPDEVRTLLDLQKLLADALDQKAAFQEGPDSTSEAPGALEARGFIVQIELAKSEASQDQASQAYLLLLHKLFEAGSATHQLLALPAPESP